MRMRLRRGPRRLSLAQRFMVTSLFILVGGLLSTGWWVGEQIEQGVVHRAAATTALFVDGFIAASLQELASQEAVTPEHAAALSQVFQEAPLSQQIVALKVWDAGGRIVYSTNPANIGRVYPVERGLARAWQGEVVAEISSLGAEENVFERDRWSRLLETYSPVRQAGTDRVIAVAEFYQQVDALQQEIDAARLRSWLLVGLAMVVMYLLLAGSVRRASHTIERQRAALSAQVDQLTALLAQNDELHERVRRAAAGAAALNERFLRRISAELHDGPIQDLSAALLRIDDLADSDRDGSPAAPAGERTASNLVLLHTTLAHALREIRTIAAGLSLPELTELTLAETLTRAVRAHERRSGTAVELEVGGVPAQAHPSVKIALYRVVQEALNNAHRHGGGVGQRVRAGADARWLEVTVSDRGNGFDPTALDDTDGHLGLVSMRERVESLGGLFRIESGPGLGTRVSARLPLPTGRKRA